MARVLRCTSLALKYVPWTEAMLKETPQQRDKALSTSTNNGAGRSTPADNMTEARC